MTKSVRIPPELVVFIGVVFVSSSAILIRFSHAQPVVVAAYRMGFSAVLMIPFMFGRRKEFAALTGKDFFLCVMSGIFLALHFWSWITSLSYTSVAAGTVLVNTHPIFVVLASWLVLKEKSTSKSILFMTAALGGSIVLALDGGGGGAGDGRLFGNGLAVVGAITVSGYLIIGRILRERVSTSVYTLIVYSVSTLFLVCAALLQGIPLYPLPGREFIIFLSLAVFPTLLGHSVFSWSLKYVKASFVSTAVLGEPVFATIAAVFFFHEVPGGITLLGAAIVLVSIYLFNRETRIMGKHIS